MQKTFIKKFVAFLGTALIAGASHSASFPDKPLTLVVPYAPGGNTDQVGRLVAKAMSEKLGQSVVVQNKPGANATIGNSFVAKAEPDGYTLLVGNTSMVLNPLLYNALPYDQANLEPLAMVVQFPLVMVANNDVPVNNAREFVDYTKEQKGKVNFASAGLGNSTHLAGELFKIKTGADMTHIPYNGSALGLTAVVGGDVHTFFDTTVTALPLVQSKKLKALAIASQERIASMPDTPTMIESGYPEYGAVTAWQGIFIPKGTPDDVRDKLREAVNAALADPNSREWAEKQGGQFFPVDKTGVAAQEFVSSERTRWTDLVQSLGIKLDQ